MKKIAMVLGFFCLLILMIVAGNFVQGLTRTSSTPLPGFLNGVAPTPDKKGVIKERVCVDVNSWGLVEIGDIPDEVEKHMTSNLQITVNDRLIPKGDAVFWFTGPLHSQDYLMFNGGPKFRSSSFYCLKTTFVRGANTVKIQTVSLHGQVHTYTWSFFAEEIVPADESLEVLVAEFAASPELHAQMQKND
jgi:hypothetical protein